MLYLYRRLLTTIVVAMLTFATLAAGQKAADAQAVAQMGHIVLADGACDLNASWEQKTTPDWYIEQQRYGVDYIEAGIQREDPSLISEGLTIFNWGFAKEASDGSFPGMAHGYIGGEYHSASLWVEAVARATMDLAKYKPTTYTLPTGYYSATIKSYSSKVELTAKWLVSPAVQPSGEAFDSPFTHRRYVLAAALEETGELTGDSTLIADSIPYIQNGLSLQLGAGWTAAIAAPVNGVVAPAILVAPGQPDPTGTVATISAVGVNPESSGYDPSYQCVGLLYAERWAKFAPKNALYTEVQTMLNAGLNWESTQINASGVVSTLGASRMGVNPTLSGLTIKTVSFGEVQDAFCYAPDVLGPCNFPVVGARAQNNIMPALGTNPTVASDGAVGSNVALDTNPSASWNIANQNVGADFVAAGVAREDDAMIVEGITILNWGFAHQKSNGSIIDTSTNSYPYDASQFLEAAARAALILKNYDPTLPGTTKSYASTVSSITTQLSAAAAWLTSASLAPAVSNATASFTFRYCNFAAALAETASLTGNAAYTTAAQKFMQSAISMQSTNGGLPELGAYSVNHQAFGALNAESFYNVSADSNLNSATEEFIDNAITWEEGYVAVCGTVNTTSPAVSSVQNAFLFSNPVTNDPNALVFGRRLFPVSAGDYSILTPEL